MSMCRDRHSGMFLRLSDSSQHSVHALGYPLFVCGAFQNCRLDPRVTDSLFDIANEQLSHPFRPAKGPPGTAHVKMHRDFVICIKPGRYQNVDTRSLCNSLNAWNVAAEANHRKICLLYTSDAADERSSVDL